MLLPRFQKRRLEKAQRKREARAVDRLEQELLKDTVKFGEVVLQPPELTVQPRRSTSRDAVCGDQGMQRGCGLQGLPLLGSKSVLAQDLLRGP